MKKNLKLFIIKFIIVIFLLFAIRSLFQIPIEYFKLKMFYEQVTNRVVSKGDAIKVITVMGALFVLALREKLSKIKHPEINVGKSFLLIIAGIIFVALYYYMRYITNLYSIESGIPYYGILLLKTVFLSAALVFVVISVFQLPYAINSGKLLWKELSIAGSLSVIVYFALMLFQAQWRFFTDIVLFIVGRMLRPIHTVNYSVSANDNLLQAENFRVSIGESCSGIDSMLLFSVFSTAVFALDYKRINKAGYVASFIIGLIGVFLVNNIRIFLLILTGVHISPELALGLFHTHAGWILFLMYFAVYYMILKKYLIK